MLAIFVTPTKHFCKLGSRPGKVIEPSVSTKIYFLIILLDNGRRHIAPNQMFHYATGRHIDEILSTPWLPDLHEDIEIVYIRTNQLTGKSIDHCHSISYCIDKPAARREQPFDTTAKVQLLLKELPR